MEEKLKAIVAKIESSSLSNEDKEALFDQISESMHNVVVPILLKYVSKEELDVLTNKSSQDLVDGYVELIKNSVKDGKALQEVAQEVTEVLIDVEAALKEGGVV